MLATFPHLSKNQLEKLAEVTKHIIKTVKPERIICYGSHTSISQDWNVFSIGESYQQVTFPTTYNLLIVPGKEDVRLEHEVIQLAEQQAEALHCHISVVIQSATTLNQSLENGVRFINTVFSKGLLLYNNNAGITTPSPTLPDMSVVKKAAEQQWQQNMEIAHRFLKSASDNLQQPWAEQAMFNLHQSVQHTCMALLRYFTGYKSTTHNLSRLLALLESFTCMFEGIFPCITEEEKELFNLLNRAYSEARYKDNYVVPVATAKILERRVKELIALAEALYEKQAELLKSETRISFPINDSYDKA